MFLRVVVAISLPLLFVSRAKDVRCPCENLFAYVMTFSEFEIQFSSFPFSCPIDVVEHSREDNSLSKVFRLNVPFSQNIIS